MASDYRKIREDNIVEYGQGTRHLSFLGRLYTDRTHFIFELLQNAEDAGASKVLFHLFSDRLEVTHDGRLFDELDVRGICGVGEGTKADDLTQIGKFGIGFKSVYAYTCTPIVYSGSEAFKIENYVRPYGTEPRRLEGPDLTLFIFPFDLDDPSSEIACGEISSRLLNLSTKTLLFLRRIREIEYRLSDSSGGVYLREEVSRGPSREVTVVGQRNDENHDESWLVFERSVNLPDSGKKPQGNVNVEIGFQLRIDERDQSERIERIKESPLVVTFPTEKQTRFGFLTQGPYKTTPARDNVPKEDPWNVLLVKETSILVTDALKHLKEMGFMTVDLLAALPIRMDDFPEDSMFYAVFDSVRKALMNENLLPADDGTFVSAMNAKLARSADIRKLLSHTQLSSLFQSGNELKWLVGTITSDRTPDLRAYLINGLNVEEVTPRVFARRITDAFLENQSDDWLVEFYKYLSDKEALWRISLSSADQGGYLRTKTILRLEDNSHVPPFKSNGTPNAYLPTTLQTSFPTIKRSLCEDEDVLAFMKKLGIIEVDEFSEIIEFILPKYSLDEVGVTQSENIDDLKRIERFLCDPSVTNSQDAAAKVRMLLQRMHGYEDSLEMDHIVNYILNRHGGPNGITMMLRRHILPSARLVRSSNCTGTSYRMPKEVYRGSPELHDYFSGNPETWFASVDYPEDVQGFLLDIGVSAQPRVKKRKPNDRGFVTISDSHGSHARGLEGFDPEITVDGIEDAIASTSSGTAAYVWNKIVLQHKECIRGVIERSSRQTYANCTRKEQISKFGRLLIETAWLPGMDGSLHKPNELRLDDLPSEFVRDEQLADRLGMMRHEHEQAMDLVTRGDSDLKKLIEHYQASSSRDREKMLRLIPQDVPSEPVVSFRDGLKAIGRDQRGKICTNPVTRSRVTNPGRYQERAEEHVSERVEDYQSNLHTLTFSPLRDRESNREARNFLYEQYNGRCQITQTTFPKAARNSDGTAENYFEACTLLSSTSAGYLNDPGNMLCVSADTMAKIKHASLEFLENVEEAIRDFKANGTLKESVSVKIRLAGEECAIQWSQPHFMRLIALYEEA